MPSLNESLDQILRIDGARMVALVDVGTGMVIDSVGDEPAGLPAAAAGLADETRLAAAALGDARPGGDLEELLLVTANRFHLMKVLDRREDDGLLLFVELDRAQTNIALAARQVAQAAPAVLA